MNIDIVRQYFTDRTTIGKVAVDGVFRCWSLEDCCREAVPRTWRQELKIPGRTAIPYGRYEVTVTHSYRFGRAMPLLLQVPDFEGVRIHKGNTEADTHGCILVGGTRGQDFIGDSTVAFSTLYLDIYREIERGKVWLEITKGAA